MTSALDNTESTLPPESMLHAIAALQLMVHLLAGNVAPADRRAVGVGIADHMLAMNDHLDDAA